MGNDRTMTTSAASDSSSSREDVVMQTGTNGLSSSAASNKRKRSANGCVVAENDVIVEELQKIRGKIRESSHLAGNYGRAIMSIQNHTDAITSAREAKQLRNIGNYIANQIQSILQKHQIGNGTAPPSTAATTEAIPRNPTPTISGTDERFSAVAPRRDYIPAQGKQPWYVLRTLREADADSHQRAVALGALLSRMQRAGFDGTLAKLRVCITSLVNTHRIVQKVSDSRVFLNERGQRSAAFCVDHRMPPPVATQEPSMSSQLVEATTAIESINVPAVRTSATPRSSSLVTSTGAEAQRTVCIDLSDSEDDSDTETIRATSLSPREYVAPEPEFEPMLHQHRSTSASNEDLVRDSDEWEIVLILDHREVLSRRNRDILERKLLDVNVTCEVRSLNVGDVQWVARRYRGFESVDEFMLNVIVERKEVRDLSGSIIDRRYNEQKTRLRDSGMTHVIYLVEGSLTQQTTVRASGLQTALCRTQIQNQFFVQQCQNADESVALLRGVHMSLLAKLPLSMRCRNRERTVDETRSTKLFSTSRSTSSDWEQQFCRPIRSYSEFNAQFRKKADFTAGEIYQMMLMQLHGLSSSRTVALSELYPTLQHLTQATEKGDRIEDVRYGESQRRLGIKTAQLLKFQFQSIDYERDTPSASGLGQD